MCAVCTGMGLSSQYICFPVTKHPICKIENVIRMQIEDDNELKLGDT